MSSEKKPQGPLIASLRDMMRHLWDDDTSVSGHEDDESGHKERVA